jgi:serine/threonine-protein kinase
VTEPPDATPDVEEFDPDESSVERGALSSTPLVLPPSDSPTVPLDPSDSPTVPLPAGDSPTLPVEPEDRFSRAPTHSLVPKLEVREFTPDDSDVYLSPYVPTSESGRAHRVVHPVTLPPGAKAGALGIDGYTLGDELGRGAQGVVYRATPDAGGPDVAIKVLRPEAGPVQLERFERALDAMAALDDVSGVVRLLGRGHTRRGSPYAVLQLVHGPSLRAVLRRGRLAPRQLVELLIDVAYAVHQAHDRGIIHRDLKPENVLIEWGSSGVRPRVADFGLARDLSQSDPTSTGGGLGGTPAYMAPEQVLGEAVTRRIDVYALGAILYEVITGWPPYRKGNAAAVAHAIVTEPPARPRVQWTGLPAPLEDVALRALAKDPNARQPTAAAFAQQLRSALAGEELPDVPQRKDRLKKSEGLAERLSAPPQGRRRFVQGLLFGLASGAAAGVLTGLYAWPG